MRVLAILLLLIAEKGFAQITPQPGEGDPRIQTVEYNPTQIIRLSVASGVQTMVELAPGERIETIGVGNSNAWQVSAGKRGDFFFVKNINATAMTNMTIVTSSRVYNFELVPSEGYGQPSPYHVKITYSGREKKSILSETKTDLSSSYVYRLSGSKAIRPSSVLQEGSQTIIIWPFESPLPATFMLQNRTETLVNGEMQDERFVIAGTPEKLVFRLGRLTAYAKRKPIRRVNND
jgi:type IV secretion system protein VirB9